MPLNKRTETLILLHLAVFLAGWTGIFGRIISLGGLPLVWYRSMVALGVLAAVLALTRRLHRVPLAAVLRIAGCGVLLGIHWVAFYASIKASNVSVGVACIATSCFFTAIFEPLINRHGLSWKDFLISFIAIAGIMLIFSLDVRYRLGIALGLLSAAVYSVFAILNVRVADDSEVVPVAISVRQEIVNDEHTRDLLPDVIDADLPADAYVLFQVSLVLPTS